MANTRGIFSLREVLYAKEDNLWVSLDDVWMGGVPTPTPNVGYFGSGTYSNASISTTDKITYSTNTTEPVPGGSMVVPRYYYTGAGNNSVGYFAAGQMIGGGFLTSVEKLSYSTDTFEGVPGANLFNQPQSRYRYGTGNETAAYWAGGGIPEYSSTAKLTYSVETVEEVPTAALSAARYGFAATGNQSIGYFAGGSANAGQPQSITDKITYSIDTTSPVPSANLSVPNRYANGASSSDTAYITGGTSVRSIVQKITYSDDTISTSSYPLTTEDHYHHASVSSSSAGYVTGTMGTSQISFSNDVTGKVPGANLSLNRGSLGGLSSKSNALPGIVISESTRYSDGQAESNKIYNAGYFLGGDSNFPKGKQVHRFAYSTGTIERLPSADMPTQRVYAATAGSSTSGYLVGGRAPSIVSTTHKVTYGVDTTSSVPTAALSSARYMLGGAGKSDAGYFVGGNGPAVVYSTSVTDKITYSNDTSQLAPTANLVTTERTRHFMSGDQTKSYIAGGKRFGGPGISWISLTLIEKLTFTSDTMSPVTASLSAARSRSVSTSSSDATYFTSGTLDGPPYPYSLTEKILFSTESVSLVPGATAINSSGGSAATSNQSAGHYAGGYGNNGVEKIIFSSDTMVLIPSSSFPDHIIVNGAGTGPLDYGLPSSIPQDHVVPRLVQPTPTTQTAGSYYPGPVSTLGNNGYFAGGYIPALPGSTSTVSKLNYSTDTQSAAIGGFNVPVTQKAATGNSSHGYFGGGIYQLPGTGSFILSKMEKYSYASETMDEVPSANLSLPRYYFTATGNSTHGYFAGGYRYSPTAYYSTVDKVTYSTDTTEEVPGAALDTTVSSNRRRVGATGNSTHGYFAGGGYPGLSIMEKLEYSTDTMDPVPTASLSAARYDAFASGNSTEGYFAGGYFSGSSPNRHSTTDKLIYSSDTTSPVPGANLPYETYNHAATGNSTAGYFGGGIIGGYSSSMIKIDYTTTTAAEVASAAFTSGGISNMGASSPLANALPAAEQVLFHGPVVV